ncbi:16S rRNA (cytosine(967)-C(5))-methyltransferase RsmB [Conexibacter arvalis]|uniref:16S rRNA (cytosine(967)-C(5))-methyltransferase n=1 Tax=Conexibacter arvalis TaxID=912552 RepID=A0A840IKX2_9ACTN|nr:16S rRNA (cytosine(967)-C(5))-methyltransferase RsmB [Conexibacter arvalis]MBB4664664.1 16S rRNA (cytosine967-C5)-methyltransferase [Conexibacter arvalis]
MPSVASPVSPARRVAAAVLRRVEDEGAYADRALAGEAARAGLDGREHAFATALAYGAVQRRRTLDHVIARLTRRPPGQLDPPVRDALRLGLLQLIFLDGVAAHAAVDQSVELAKAAGGPGYRLVNAVLRRASREGRRIVEQLDDRTPEGAALRHSVPDWIARMWWESLGPDEARALLARVNQPAESALRVNTLAAEPVAVAAALAGREVAVRPAQLDGRLPGGEGVPDGEGVPGYGGAPGGAAAAVLSLPEGLVADGAFDLRGDPLFADGALLAQSRAAMAAARLLDPQPGERVLDLCAAPGGKTTHLAALMGGSGAVVAVERHPGRAEALRRTCARLRADWTVAVETGDASEPRRDGPFDRVLVDPPCSGLGTLQGRPDLRWRATAESVAELARLQGRILAAGAAALAPGGTLLYVTCTISPDENEGVIEAFLDADPAFALDDLGAELPRLRSRRAPRTLQLLPHRDGTDGFFLARLRRSS